MYLAALHVRTTERAVSVDELAPPEPFMRMHSLFGATITPLISVVSELPRKSVAAWSLDSLFELVLGWTPVKLATLIVVRGVSASLPLLSNSISASPRPG